MCLGVMALRVHREYPLILAANRDEFDDRPAQPAHFWPDFPWVVAGRDQREGGTWLGVSSRGRLALLTNVRGPASLEPGRPSRGNLVAEYLKEQESEVRFWTQLRRMGPAYNGYNLVFGSGFDLSWFSNVGGEINRISAGVHGLSNAFWNTPWPKVLRGRAGLWSLLHGGRTPGVEELFALLADTSRPSDDDLPDTGIGLEKERMLAPICVHSPDYGTQVSTVILVHNSGRIDFWEKGLRRGKDVRHFRL
ncbi:MAG: NRDE family protein [Desulfovermiculus sp.]|nr:NRDE family protein [Desulfovermiculus sp.]